MRHDPSMMSAVLACALVLAACPADEPMGSGTTTDEPPATTSTDGSSSGDSTSTGADTGSDSSSTTGEPEPLPEFDCDGVDMVLDGNAIIESTDDLDMLTGIGSVTGSIIINETNLADLDALGCVTTIGEDLQIFGNQMLTNVDGLVNVTEIGGSLTFSNNGAVTDFDGLQRLTKVEQSFSMNSNDAMTVITGFDSLVGIEGNITIRDNAVLTNIDGLKGLMVVGGTLAITANPMLCLSSVGCVGDGIVSPPVIPPDWTTNANDPDC